MNTPPSDNPFLASRLNAGTDYHAAWDVPELNRSITDDLVKQIRAVKGRVKPDPSQMIQVLQAPPGYGKTHLFGRIAAQLDEEVLFVFVPAFEDVSRALEHIRRYVVATVFQERPGRPPVLYRALAGLCQKSFIEYVSQFPPSLAARYQSLLQGLQANPEAALAIIGAVKTFEPFKQLAASIAKRLPQIPFSVIHTLALGWSPLADVACRWLGGDFLPKEELALLDLPDGTGPPSPLDVLKGIAPLLRYKIPLVICCDQMEMVLKHPKGPAQVTAELIEILHQVPNQILIVSCLQTEWPKFLSESFTAFQQRVAKPWPLNDLTEMQAVDLIARRLEGWKGRQPDQRGTWPFDEASIISYVRDRSQNPRILIQRCGELFKEWLEGDRKGLLYVTPPIATSDPSKLFLQMWNAELEAIAKDPAVNWSSYQEERFYRAVREVMIFARDAGRDMAGIRVRNVGEEALGQRGKVKRWALFVDVTTGGQDYRLVIPVTALNNGQHFRYYFEDIEAVLEEQAVGCLLLHRQTAFQVGGATAKRFETMLGKQLRVFSLEENQPVFHRLECLLRFLDRAVGKELQLGDVTLDYKDCQDYLLKTAVLDNLGLLKELGCWRKAQPVHQTVASGRVAQVASVEANTTAAVNTPVAVLPPGTKNLLGSSTPLTPNLNDLKIPTQEPWALEKLTVLVAKLKLWGLPVKPAGVEIGPSFARLKVEPEGSKTSFNRVQDRTTDLKIQLGLRINPLIDSQPGYISVDVELPHRRMVALAEVFKAPPARLDGQPAFPVGVDVGGHPHWLDLSDTADCHLLIAGQTGSGKSEFLRAMIAALARRLGDEQIQFILMDPKRVTFNLGSLESPYLKFPIAYDADATLPLLQWCREETDKRYQLLAAQKKTNVNQLDDQALLPCIVVVVDEFADLLTEKGTKQILNALLKQIGAMSRAAGIHLALATQRPDKDVVTPLLKSNLPGKIALRVASEANSKLVLGDNYPGAAYLLGKGDLLWQRGGDLQRLQSPYVSQNEFEQALKAH